MDALSLIILNIISALILIGYVVFNSIKRNRIKKAAEAAKSDLDQPDHSDERHIC